MIKKICACSADTAFLLRVALFQFPLHRIHQTQKTEKNHRKNSESKTEKIQKKLLFENQTQNLKK